MRLRRGRTEIEGRDGRVAGSVHGCHSESINTAALVQRVNLHLQAVRAQDLMRLQRSLGNRAVNRLFTPGDGRTLSRKAEVKDFASRWTKGPLVDEKDPATRGRNANLHILVRAEFKKGNGLNPADAEYKQFVKDKWEITAPAHRKGVWSEKPQWEDDGYSRADDMKGRRRDDTVFMAQDFPGWHHSSQRHDQLLATDTVDVTFSAKQQIIDTSDQNRVIAEIPEHTATITGAHPRTYTGVDQQIVGVESGEYT